MWQAIEGHDAIVEYFRRSIARGRLASTFLFVGPPGVGKHAFAYQLAKSLLCQTHPNEELTACGRCESCVQVDAATHPDLILISKPAEKSEIPVAAFIGEKENRMRAGLCRDISMKPFMGGRKVAIINDADALNEEGANCLLKTLEEPPPQSVLILIGASADRQLPTIRSRAQIVRFQPLSVETVAALLQTKHGIEDPAEARRLAEFSEGSIERALEMAGEDLWNFRRQLLRALSDLQFDSVGWSKPVMAFVDEAGKDAASRRRRLRQLVTIAAEFFRQLLRADAGLQVEGDDELKKAVAARLKSGGVDREAEARKAERCLDALEYVDRNANQSVLAETWLDSLRT
jgi:DNA polymerase-3 subunit delta'